MKEVVSARKCPSIIVSIKEAAPVKTAIDRTPAEKAPKHLKLFMTWGVALSGVGLIIMPFLGVAGLAFSGRALMLTYHPANHKDPKLMLKRILCVLGIVAGAVDMWFMYSKH
jgi:hypothetical protein